MKPTMICLLIIAIFAVSLPLQGAELTAEKVIQNVVSHYEKQMKNVNDLTIVTDKYTTYQKRAKVEGKTVYKTRYEIEMMGKKFITIYDGVYEWRLNPVNSAVKKEKLEYNPYLMWENLKTVEAKYGGTENIDGRKTHILNITDMVKLMGVNRPKEMPKGKVSGKIWVDAKDWVIRKMEMDVKPKEQDEQPGSVKTIIKREDFRKVDGMLIAHRISVTMGAGAMNMSPEQRQRMREALKEMREQLEGMSEEQRKMVESMMGQKDIQKLLGGAGTEIVTEVKEVKINSGLSDDLFDGSKLK